MSPSHSQRGFTIVELMIVVAVIALLASIAVPNYQRVRKRAQATLALDELRVIEEAIGQYALENNRNSGDTATFDDLRGYIKPGSRLATAGSDILGNPYGPFEVSRPPRVNEGTYQNFSDVTTPEFWKPFLY